MEYLFILMNAAAMVMLAAGVLMLWVSNRLVMGRRVGGLQFFTFGRFGGSFYVTRQR
jgi:hypothetical protein